MPRASELVTSCSENVVVQYLPDWKFLEATTISDVGGERVEPAKIGLRHRITMHRSMMRQESTEKYFARG